jgi:hypothetical protein
MRNQFTREQVALGRNDPDLAAVGEATRCSPVRPVVETIRNQFSCEQVALGRHDPDLAAVGKTTPSSAGFSPGRRPEIRNRGR